MNQPLFELGEVIISARAHEALQIAGQDAGQFLTRHQSGDWGFAPADQAHHNAGAVDSGSSLLSVYRLRSGAGIGILTNRERSRTMVLLESEFSDYWANLRTPDWRDIYGVQSAGELVQAAQGQPLMAWLEQRARAVWQQDYDDRCWAIDWQAFARRVAQDAASTGSDVSAPDVRQ